MRRQTQTEVGKNHLKERWQTKLEFSRKPTGTMQQLTDERRNQIEKGGDPRQKAADTLETMADSDGKKVEN